ncbi:MAG: hypothetical protein GF329_03385 [Candidatus Lokiarchaeota archaeon]|nr:hypothetical protein [Candidatus Lokiarchaeota archaeon]
MNLNEEKFSMDIFERPPMSFINRFPFTKEAKDYVKVMKITPDELMENMELLERAFDSIKKLLKKKYIVQEILDLKRADNWKQYALIGYFLNLIGEPILWSRFAEIMRNEIERNLDAEKSGGDLLRIAKNTFNWKLRRIEDKTILNQIYNWKIKWYNFISVSSQIMDENWKLINNNINNGWIFLKSTQIKRLLAEKVRKMITEKAKLSPIRIPNKIEDRIKEIKGAVKNIKESFQQSSISITSEERSEAYPPCINNIISKTKNGINLSHFERLVLVFFLLNIDFTVDEILNIFKLQPDFDEERAKYYIEHAAGKVGGRTKYKSYNCVKIQSFQGICKKDEDPWGWCTSLEKDKHIKNPLVYFSRMAWVISNSIKCPKCEKRVFKNKRTEKFPNKCPNCGNDLSEIIEREDKQNDKQE